MKALVCRGPGPKSLEDHPKPEIQAPRRDEDDARLLLAQMTVPILMAH